MIIILDVFSQWVEVTRRDPAYNDCAYRVISCVCLDNAGEWALDNDKWQQYCKQTGIELIYSCPDRKESAARAERAVGIVEVVTKALLMQQNLPPMWWQWCAIAAVWLLNRFPMTSQLAALPRDGDRMRPLEHYSRGAYSRRQIDRELSYFVAPGTPCLVQTEAKGSHVGPKTRWGVATQMYREQATFLCPHTRSTFRSKSWAAFKLRDGLNYMQYLNLPVVTTSRRSCDISTDKMDHTVITLPKMNEVKREAVSPVVQMKVAGDMADAPPVIQIVKNTSNLGGSVEVIDETSELQADVSPIEVDITEQSFVIKNDKNVLKFFDQHDAAKVKNRGIVSGGSKTFVRLCKGL